MLSSHIFNSSLHSSLPSLLKSSSHPNHRLGTPQNPRLCRNSSASHNPASRALSTKQPHRQLCSTISLHLLPILPPTRVLTSPEPQVSNHKPALPAASNETATLDEERRSPRNFKLRSAANLRDITAEPCRSYRAHESSLLVPSQHFMPIRKWI